MHQGIDHRFAYHRIRNKRDILAVDTVFHGKGPWQIIQHRGNDPGNECQQRTTHFDGLEPGIGIFHPSPAGNTDIIDAYHRGHSAQGSVFTEAQEAAHGRRIGSLVIAGNGSQGEQQVLSGPGQLRSRRIDSLAALAVRLYGLFRHVQVDG